MLSVELPVLVLFLTTPWSFSAVLLVVFVTLVVIFVEFPSPVAFLFILVGFAFLVVFFLYSEGLLDFVMLIVDVM